LRDCLDSEDEAVKFAAAKFVMEKLVTPKATHTLLDDATIQMFQRQDQSFCQNIVEACAKGNITVDEAQGLLDMKKMHADISKQQEMLDQIARIRELEARKATLIVVKSDRDRLKEAME
jgi:hypothetical protein